MSRMGHMGLMRHMRLMGLMGHMRLMGPMGHMGLGGLMSLIFLMGSLGVRAEVPDTVFASLPIPDSIFQRMQGRSYKADCTVPREELRYLQLSYRDGEGRTQQGEMVCNRAIAQDLVSIFRELWKAKYRIERMQLIDDYEADDERSMEANNTSCFNFRTIAGTTIISKHGKGMAIDVNPLYNPYVRGSYVSPEGGRPWAYRRSRRKDIPYKIDRQDLCYRLFLQHGFRWGGAWPKYQDYQHFEK